MVIIQKLISIINMNNLTECMVCCEKYNKQSRSQVVCNIGSCGFNACKSCCRQYLMNCNEDIHCMSCRKAWDNKFVILNLNRNWFINTYTPRKVGLLFELNKARAQEVMPRVELVMERKRRTILMQPQLTELNKQNCELYDQKEVLLTEYKLKVISEDTRWRKRYRFHYLIKKIRDEKKVMFEKERELYYKTKHKIRHEYSIQAGPLTGKMRKIQEQIAITKNYIRTGDSYSVVEKKEEKEKKVFIMPCQNEECSGFLSSSYKCGLCDEQCCKSCFEMLGTESDMENKEKHICNKDQVETAKLIKQTTKPCPQCGQRIYKISGCDQMWCVECKCPFSWDSGKIITKGVVHNPHYFQYLRVITNGEIARQPGDNPCNPIGDTLSWINHQARKLTTMGTIIKTQDPISNKDEYSIKECELQQLQKFDILTSLIRRIYHVEQVDLPDIRRKIEISQEYEGDLISYLAKDLSEAEYKKILQMKWKDHKKQIDKLYLADVFVNVSKDIINTIHFKFTKVGPCDIDTILHDSITELNNFITYYNEQYTIISVSHNMAGKKIQYVDYTRTSHVEITADNPINTIRVMVNYNTYKISEKTISCKISDVKSKI